MIISRIKAGWLMVAGAIFLFCVSGNFPESQIALAGLQNVLFLASIALTVVGVYFLKTSKRCQICGETVRHTDSVCNYCGYVFKKEPVQ